MSKFLVTFLMLISSLVTAHAAPNATLFGGYQYTRFGDSTVYANSGGIFSGTALNANGWNAALTAGFNSWFGIRADVSAAYPTNFNFYTYTFGPELSLHLPIIRPFAHALFGVARVSSSGIVSNNFETIIGGGVDLGHGMLAWRVAQLDWMSKGIVNNRNLRICTGLVLRF
ncbi:MAG: hypothetical protein ACRD3P_06240 [Terriglobales bacterium]